MSYITRGGSWSDIIVLNEHAPTEYKSDDTKDVFYEQLGRFFHQFPKRQIKLLFGDSNAKAGREYILKSTIRNESLH
jgi:hypothetical protein